MAGAKTYEGSASIAARRITSASSSRPWFCTATASLWRMEGSSGASARRRLWSAARRTDYGPSGKSMPPAGFPSNRHIARICP